MDCDTLTDFGKVEISIDTGQTWVNMTSGDLFSYWVVYDSSGFMIKESGLGDTILFTGISTGWYHFEFDEYLPEMPIDTIIFRFTFHSSGVIANRDGWMIDSIGFTTWWESIPEKEVSCQMYPNPVNNQMTLNSKTLISGYEISNSLGYAIKKSENKQLPVHINVSNLAPGIYFYKVKFVTGQESFGKFVKI